jgi:hypothetical protein
MLASLREDGVLELPPLRPGIVAAVAQSAGAHVLIHHQANHPQFDGVALLAGAPAGCPSSGLLRRRPVRAAGCRP